MAHLLVLIADLAELLRVGYRGRRRRAAGQPFGAYPVGWKLTPHA